VLGIGVISTVFISSATLNDSNILVDNPSDSLYRISIAST